MSEHTPTTASDMSAGDEKQGTDYGAPGTSSAQEGGSDLNEGGGGSDPGGGPATGMSAPEGGSDLNEGGGGSDPNGPAVPDEPDAAAAQGGVQEAFTVAPPD